jgi:formylglycine-generating enzyme required for sulfatase activity
MAIVLALTGVAWLAKTPIREALLKRATIALSRQVPIAGGRVSVVRGGRPLVAPLRADVHEVTNQQYRYCVEALRCAVPDEPFGDTKFADGNQDLPVVWVTAYDAAAFCSWLGRQLPTEAQWDLIAYGTKGRPYPWGYTPPVPGQVNTTYKGNRERPLQPAVPPAGSEYLSGKTVDGVEQLLGNAAEWTATLGDGIKPVGTWNGHDRVETILIMGGGWEGELPETGVPVMGSPEVVTEQTGFRCVAQK